MFEIRVDGLVQVKERLNYNTGSRYTFTVEARVSSSSSNSGVVCVCVCLYVDMRGYACCL